MSTAFEELESQTMQLPSSERAELAARLIASLDEDEDEDPAEVERAWDEELARRIAEYRAGRSRTYPAHEVLAEARALLE